MGQTAAWLCPQQRIQAGKPLHLRLPSLLSELRRNSAIATLTAVTLKKSACLAARTLLFGMGGDKWKVFSASTYSHPARVSYARAGRSLCGGRLALQQRANIADPTADATC
jgi:hypothetical protein